MKRSFVFNGKVTAFESVGVRTVIDMMFDVNSTKVRADVKYLNSRGFATYSYSPCELCVWDYGPGHRSVNVYGDGKVAETLVDALNDAFSGTDVFVGWWDYDTPRSDCVREF